MVFGLSPRVSSERARRTQTEGSQMGKFCEVCEKGAMSGHKISHSDRKSNRVWAPNVQRVRVLLNGSPRRLYVCTRCLRSGNVQRALPRMSSNTVA